MSDQPTPAQDPRQDPPRPYVGRRSKLTPDVMKRLETALRAGNYLTTAATYAGIHISTLMDWLKRGRDALTVLHAQETAQKARRTKTGRKTAKAAPEDEPKVPERERPYVELADMVKRAEAEAEMKAVLYVMSAGRENWTAAMTFLERKFPEKWGRRDRLDLNFDPKKLTTEELLSLDEMLTKAQRDD